MSLLRSAWICAVLLLAVSPLCRAQQRVVALIETNLPEATLYADTTQLGPASLGTFLIPVGTRELRLVPPGGTQWSIEPVVTAIEATPGDTLDVSLPFPYYYQIETIPFGASVTLETREGRIGIGETPLVYTAPAVLGGTISIEQKGYVIEKLKPGQEVWNRYVVTLKPLRVDEVTSAEVSWRPPRRRQRWIDYTAATLAVAAGALSVHYKFKADRLDDEYRETGDPALRPRIQSFDNRAGVALGAMQVGLGVLAVRFILK